MLINATDARISATNLELTNLLSNLISYIWHKWRFDISMPEGCGGARCLKKIISKYVWNERGNWKFERQARDWIPHTPVDIHIHIFWVARKTRKGKSIGPWAPGMKIFASPFNILIDLHFHFNDVSTLLACVVPGLERVHIGKKGQDPQDKCLLFVLYCFLCPENWVGKLVSEWQSRLKILVAKKAT